ncbi:MULTISPECIES: hypothetical protein [unclassified Nostoc]|uniref:hypothetical protein n=1 Tax=unclassified Nostoc TaxID=2593658 RepID=UPI0013D6FE22|nr:MULTISPECIES: hypothetical protein [unclassified Nostoc]MBE8998857.1 hypothetical protein [Nostoc sp. LEGE 12447]NEU82757.1 hypothetical protein [Nostoc sp. UIC 10630]
MVLVFTTTTLKNAQVKPMPDSEDPKQVSSNDLRNSQFGGGLINAGTVNAGQIGGDIYNIHLGQQTAVSRNSVQSQNQRQRSLSERDSLKVAIALSIIPGVNNSLI